MFYLFRSLVYVLYLFFYALFVSLFMEFATIMLESELKTNFLSILSRVVNY